LPKAREKPAQELYKVDNSDGLFDNLPLLTSKKDLASSRNIWEASRNTKEAKMEKAKLIIAKQNERLLQIEREEEIKLIKRKEKGEQKQELQALILRAGLPNPANAAN